MFVPLRPVHEPYRIARVDVSRGAGGAEVETGHGAVLLADCKRKT